MCLSNMRLLFPLLRLMVELSSGSNGSSLISLLKFVDFSFFIFDKDVADGESFESADCTGVDVAVVFSSLNFSAPAPKRPLFFVVDVLDEAFVADCSSKIEVSLGAATLPLVFYYLRKSNMKHYVFRLGIFKNNN